MLGFFSAKVDHPLADASEVRRVLNQLPAQEPAEALDSATAWLESLVATPEFRPERRLELIAQIDEAVLPQTRRLGRDYLTTLRQTRAGEFRLWRINYAYWSHLAAAYQDTLSRYRNNENAADALRPRLGSLCARLLNAYGSQLKWLQFRYGPIEGGFWKLAGDAYLEAERGQVAGRAIRLYANADERTPTAEYLKILLLQASSMDKLLPIEIEIAERLIAYLVPFFTLTDQARPENVYWVDAALPLPPTRLARLPDISPTLRFFATASALDALGQLRATIESKGGLPAEINFGGQYLPRLVLSVVDHLAACWSPVPPMRSHERRQVKSRMAVVAGLEAIRRQLDGQEPDGDGVESWVVEDVSQGGIGVQVSLVGKEWLMVGSLIGMQPEGGNNWLVGVVRRFNRESEAMGSVGIETLSKLPRGMIADSRGLETEIIFLDPPRENRDLRLALSVAAWVEQIPLLAEVDGRCLSLFPHTLLESGPGHMIATYRAEPAS